MNKHIKGSKHLFRKLAALAEQRAGLVAVKLQGSKPRSQCVSIICADHQTRRARNLLTILGILATSGFPVTAMGAEELDLQTLIFHKVWVHPHVHPLHVLNLSITNIHVQKADLVPGPVSEALPDQIKFDVYRAINCTSVAQSRKLDMKLIVEVGNEVTLSTNIKSQKSISGELKFTHASAGGSSSQTVDLTQSTKQNFKQTLTTEESEERMVPAKTALYVKLSRTVKSVSVPFSGSVTVDADINIRYSVGMHYAVINSESGKFSDYYPNESDRSFILTGSLVNASASEVDVTYASEQVDPSDRSICPAALPNLPSSSPDRTASPLPSSSVPPTITFAPAKSH